MSEGAFGTFGGTDISDMEEDVQSEPVGGGAAITVLEQSALSALEKAAIDVQISTAKAYPRSVERSLKMAQSLACLDARTAAGMFYTLKRGKGENAKKIMGPSTRLAEVIASSWGNLRVDAGVESVGATHLTAVAICHDLEANVAWRVRVQRRITTSTGQRYGDDMIGVTGNAAISIASRNSVFKTVPRVFVDRIDQLARVASTGKGTLQEKRAAAKQHFEKLGVTEAELFAFLEVKGWDDVSLEHIIELQGAATALKDNETTVDDLFRPEKQSAGAAAMNAAAAQAGGAAAAGGASGRGAKKKDAPPPKEDPNAEPTDGEIAQLQELMAKASDAGVKFDAMSLELAISQRVGKPIRDGINELSKALLAGGGKE